MAKQMLEEEAFVDVDVNGSVEVQGMIDGLHQNVVRVDVGNTSDVSDVEGFVHLDIPTARKMAKFIFDTCDELEDQTNGT